MEHILDSCEHLISNFIQDTYRIPRIERLVESVNNIKSCIEDWASFTDDAILIITLSSANMLQI